MWSSRPLLLTCLLLAATPVAAAERLRLSIPAGRLGDALVALGEQAHVTIGLSDAYAAARRAPAVNGTMTADEALARLLKGSSLRAVRVDETTLRIEPSPPPPARRAAPPRKPQITVATAEDEVTVTASKQGTELFRLPAAAIVLDLNRDDLNRSERGTGVIVDSLPILAETNLGAGRNKLFIRGIADSSFTGPTQSTVGQYLGDMRLNYNAPDPNLTLYDISRVEVLEGPQGTLYGAGSLGGIIRLVPAAPNAAALAGSIDAGLVTTRDGALGYDVAAMLNLPATPDLAVRGVGYRSVDGGYIDDPSRGRFNINRTTTGGGRLAARYTPGNGWTIDASGVYQSINAPDSQYTVAGGPNLMRASAIAQPFENDFGLGQIGIEKQWDNGLKLASTTGAVLHHVDATYDASGFRLIPGTLSYEESSHVFLASHETRLSRSYASGSSWVGGISLIYDRDRTDRNLGRPDNPVEITGVINRTLELAAFGEATIAVTPHLTLTAGARAGYSRTEGEPIAPRGEPQFDPSQQETRVLPTAGVSWEVSDEVSLFARYHDGFRGGGLAVARGIGVVARFEPDRLRMIDGGVRLGHNGDAFSATINGSYARWDDIQADLVATNGLPFTANVGDGYIYGLEANAELKPLKGLTLAGAVFLDKSALTNPAPAFARNDASKLPNNADIGARGSASYRGPIGARTVLVLSGSLRYVGHSRLDVGPMFHFSQGGYTDVTANAGIERGPWTATLTLDNALDSRANRFAVGNPFSAARGDQQTPPRPRNLRIGAGYRF